MVGKIWVTSVKIWLSYALRKARKQLLKLTFPFVVTGSHILDHPLAIKKKKFWCTGFEQSLKTLKSPLIWKTESSALEILESEGKLLNFLMTPVPFFLSVLSFRVRSGYGKSGKSMEFSFENSRPGKSMEISEKFWKEAKSFGNLFFFSIFPGRSNRR